MSIHARLCTCLFEYILILFRILCLICETIVPSEKLLEHIDDHLDYKRHMCHVCEYKTSFMHKILRHGDKQRHPTKIFVSSEYQSFWHISYSVTQMSRLVVFRFCFIYSRFICAVEPFLFNFYVNNVILELLRHCNLQISLF